MKLGIMQPYFMPYIGYWQRINAVDKHVIYDDVNFIKGGWINRNRILLNGEPHFFNLPMQGASSNKLINEVKVQNNKIIQEKMLKTLEQAYRKAPFYYSIIDILESIIRSDETNLAKYLVSQIHVLCQYLGIGTEILVSSDIGKNNSLKSQDKIIDICKIMGASEYYNASTGRELYDKKKFAENNMQLYFIEANDVTYKQYDKFVPSLSIIDVMMFNSVEEIRKMLGQYTIS